MKQSEKEGKEREKEPTSVDEMCDVTQDARSFDDSAHPRLVSTLVEPFSATRAVFKMCLFFDFMGVSCGVFGVPAVLSRLTVSVGRFSGGARRSDGAAPIDHQDLLVKAGRHVGDCRDVVWRVRPRTRGALGAPMSFSFVTTSRTRDATVDDERTATGRPSRTSSSVAHHRVPYPPDPVPL